MAANNVYYWKGVLVLNEITPVINALFGHYSLAPSEDPGTARIRCSFLIDGPCQTDTIWRDIVKNLRRVAEGAGLEVSHATPRIEVLEVLSSHYDRSSSRRAFVPENFETLLGNAFARPTPEKLFALAIILNDGHGLTTLMTEGAWERNDGFGGQGAYCSNEFSVATSSLQAFPFGNDVRRNLLTGDLGTTAFHFARAVEGLLSGIHSRTTRSAIRRRLASILSYDHPLKPDSPPIFGPCAIDFDASRCDRSSTV